MSVFNDWELSNRESAGYVAMDNGNWRLAYDCFMDCLRYVQREMPWDDESISRYESLAEACNSHF